MEPNPYESSQSVPAGSSPGKLQLWLHLGKFERVVLVGLGVFILAATVHRCQFYFTALGSYTQSPLIAIELIGVLACLLVIPILVIRFVYLAWCGRLTAAILSLGLSLLAMVVIFAAMIIDPFLEEVIASA